METAHRRALATQAMLGIYLASVVGSVAWYALVPTAQSLAPDIAVTVLFALTGVVFLAWQIAAYRLVPAFTGHESERTAGWAVWGYIVPIMSLWVPYQIVREIDDASAPGDLDVGFEPRRTAPPVALWWGVWVVWGIAAQIFGRMPDEALGSDDLWAPANVVGMAVLILQVVVTVLAFVVVRRVDEDQQAAAARRV